MAALQFDLVSPERSLASFEATQVQIPGAEGDMTVMADHAPTITTLRPGILKVATSGGTQEFVVTGGFAEITATGASVLAEHAVPTSDMTPEMAARMREDAQTVASGATGEAKDAADKIVAEMAEISAHLGL